MAYISSGDYIYVFVRRIRGVTGLYECEVDDKKYTVDALWLFGNPQIRADGRSIEIEYPSETNFYLVEVEGKKFLADEEGYQSLSEHLSEG